MTAAAGIVTVRPFTVEDLDGVAVFCARARETDPLIEPFAQRLGLIATGPRALLELWSVAEGEDQQLYGLAFTAVRDQGRLDFYAAVDPAMRRQGLGRALAEPAVSAVLQSAEPVKLRARVRDDAVAGKRFLGALGFREVSAQLSLHWPGRSKPEMNPMPALRVRVAQAKDEKVLQRLSAEAWQGAPESFVTRSDEIKQLFDEQGRLVLLAESDGKALGYLSAVTLGRTLGIEEVAVMPDVRRAGIGRALVVTALKDAQGAVLSVVESNKPARALYRSLGFTQTARKLVLELSRE